MNVVSTRVRSMSGRSALVVSMLVLLGISSAAQAQPVVYVQNGYALDDPDISGSWGGQGGAVLGPADGACAAMGALDKVNLLADFGFNLPGDAVITDVAAHVKAGSNGGQNVLLQLASNATVDPPTLLGASLILGTTDVGQGNCGSTVVTTVSAPPGSWGVTSANLLAVVNNTAFGLVFTKAETSNVKVDAVCLEISYTSATGENVQEACFSEPLPESNTITVEKTVVGAAPGSVWAFTGDLDPFNLPAAGGFQVFTDLVDGTYTINETTKEGYEVSVACFSGQTLIASGDASVDVAVAGDISVTCEFINTEIIPPQPASRATFTVNKTFTDGNTETAVTYNISCNTGVPLIQEQTAPAGTFAVEFVVESFDQGELDCHVWESAVAGYSPEYTVDETEFSDESADSAGCNFDAVDSSNYVEGDMNVCQISNSPDPVTISVTKDWVIDGAGGDVLDPDYTLTLSCDDQEDQIEFNSTGTADAVYTFGVIPDWDGGTNCSVDEQTFDDSIEIDNGCFSLHVDINQGDSCTITNTVFFEGIPTLSQYGMAILALLMLGVGFVGLRRFV